MNETFWGKHTVVDIQNCDISIITDPLAIEEYIVQLCELIDMKRFGSPKIVHFGDDAHIAGFSFVQLISTSLLSGHFANESRKAYIDIFSCKDYDELQVITFTGKFFGGSLQDYRVLLRK